MSRKIFGNLNNLNYQKSYLFLLVNKISFRYSKEILKKILLKNFNLYKLYLYKYFNLSSLLVFYYLNNKIIINNFIINKKLNNLQFNYFFLGFLFCLKSILNTFFLVKNNIRYLKYIKKNNYLLQKWMNILSFIKFNIKTKTIIKKDLWKKFLPRLLLRKKKVPFKTSSRLKNLSPPFCCTRFAKSYLPLRSVISSSKLIGNSKLYRIVKRGFPQFVFLQLWEFFCKWSLIKKLSKKMHWKLLDKLQYFSGWTKNLCFLYWTYVQYFSLKFCWKIWNSYNGFNRFDWWNMKHMPYKFLIYCFNENLMPKVTKPMKKGLSIMFRYSYKYRRLIFASPLLKFRALKFLIKPYLFWWLYFIYLWFIFYIKTLFSLWIRNILTFTQGLLYKVKYPLTSNFLWLLTLEEGASLQFSKKQKFYFKFFYWNGLNRIMRWRYSLFPPIASTSSILVNRAIWRRRSVFFIVFLRH